MFVGFNFHKGRSETFLMNVNRIEAIIRCSIPKKRGSREGETAAMVYQIRYYTGDDVYMWENFDTEEERDKRYFNFVELLRANGLMLHS